MPLLGAFRIAGQEGQIGSLGIRIVQQDFIVFRRAAQHQIDLRRCGLLRRLQRVIHQIAHRFAQAVRRQAVEGKSGIHIQIKQNLLFLRDIQLAQDQRGERSIRQSVERHRVFIVDQRASMGHFRIIPFDLFHIAR